MVRTETIEAVARMQEYIEAHLGEKITLKQLANAAHYSPWHCSRMFKEQLGKTPFDYIRALRLSKAALILREGKAKIIDIALDYVFDSHEGFTRAFSKEFGLSPKKYMERTPPIRLFLPSRIMDYHQYLQQGESVVPESKKPKTVFVQVIERPARKLMLKRGIKAEEYFAYCQEVGCDIWPLLTSVKEALYEPVGLWLPTHLIKPGTSKYVQGVELPLDYANELPEGFDLIELPPCSMMVFQGEPYEEERYHDAIAEIWDCIETYDPKLYGYAWAPEAAPRFQLAPMGYRGYIEARPVKPVNTER